MECTRADKGGGDVASLAGCRASFHPSDPGGSQGGWAHVSAPSAVRVDCCQLTEPFWVRPPARSTASLHHRTRSKDEGPPPSRNRQSNAVDPHHQQRVHPPRVAGSLVCEGARPPRRARRMPALRAIMGCDFPRLELSLQADICQRPLTVSSVCIHRVWLARWFARVLVRPDAPAVGQLCARSWVVTSHVWNYHFRKTYASGPSPSAVCASTACGWLAGLRGCSSALARPP
jgi:hypothetical protein